ncbi:type II toxin-antitoxin system VapB family antitoxin [Candidatus Venteria ishoeyi]|uniref:Uncharacterized protein n=1 Tax=Candidatus Venteria ishoeyi TaxID=1899563 RepID=A0A1H6FD14_9GAMM|nr:type II toxin-antitoxin system VapB family antitoxin [Candidatus Venteria ishoeyi]MDM8545297.1 type II toxin-antitoxin system VapB family antitoxin [Candidatus Venteria ishoeyi]SEH07937.1 Uncharacterised protein [Candidatus Venteria ishoeyi]
MNIHTVIDDQLFQQAVHITGMTDKRILLEYALRSLLQVQQSQATSKADSTASEIDFWEHLQHFRSTVDLSELGDIDEIFANVRDKDVGRTVEL